MDRNQQARERFASEAQKREAQRLQQEFARAVAGGSASVIDRFGQRIDAGSLILFHPPYDYVYTVVDVAPVLAPNVPPGYMRLTLELKMQATVPVNQPQMTMVSVGRNETPADPIVNVPIEPTPIQPPPTSDEGDRDGESVSQSE